MKRVLTILMLISMAAGVAAQTRSGPSKATPATAAAPATPATAATPATPVVPEEERLYKKATDLLNESAWEAAAEAYRQAAKLRGRRASAALYWTAYAQSKQGRYAEALNTLAALRRDYADSAWIDEAGALQLEIRQASGQKVQPESVVDEDLKLLAIHGLMNMEPERAVPLIEKFLEGSHSASLKEQALFVLAQSDSPRAREVMAQVAAGKLHPHLQIKAIEYLGSEGGAANLDLLARLYASGGSVEVKRSILQAFAISEAADHLLAAARSERNPELRRAAIQGLGTAEAAAALMQLFREESSPELKEEVLQALGTADAQAQLIEIARGERNPALKHKAIEALGVAGGAQAREALLALYNSDPDRALREQVIEALFVADEARALIDLARKESDPALRREIVEKLANMDSREATEYMLEILNK